jgi:predicted RND superfamily exporter protein
LPPDQLERIEILREITALASHENARFLPPPVRINLEGLQNIPPSPLELSDLPKPVQALLGSGVDEHRMLLFPAGNMWDLRETAELYRQIREHFPETPVAGQYLAMGALYNVVEADKPRIVGAALVLVLLATVLYMRRKVHALLAVGALLAGLGWAAAMLALLRIPISLANVVGIPILFGIGIDVIIHLLHRMAEEGPGRLLRALATTGWASGLSSATTVLSFAALTLASSEGVRGLGHLVVVGLTSVTICALVMLPLAWATVWKLGGVIPEGGYVVDDDDVNEPDED